MASKGDAHMQHTRWCHSMAGVEYARLYSWGNDPKRKVSLIALLSCPVALHWARLSMSSR